MMGHHHLGCGVQSLADLRLKRACALVNRLEPMSREERLAHLTDRAPGWLRPLIGPWRYLLLAALIGAMFPELPRWWREWSWTGIRTARTPAERRWT